MAITNGFGPKFYPWKVSPETSQTLPKLSQSSPRPPKALQDLPQTLPKLLQDLPELTQRPSVPPELPGDVKGSHLRCLPAKMSFLALIPGSPGSPGSRGSSLSGVISYGSGPPFHTRRGSG